MDNPFIPGATVAFTAGAASSSQTLRSYGGEPVQIRIVTPAASPVIYVRFDGQAATSADMPIYGGVIESFTLLANWTAITSISSGANVTGAITLGRGF